MADNREIESIRDTKFLNEELELDPSVMYITTEEIERWLGYTESEEMND